MEWQSERLVRACCPVAWLLAAGMSASIGCHERESHEVELEPRVLVVRVVGRDFAWNFQLCGPDGRWDTEDDIRRAGYLVVPMESEVELQITSWDYVYTLSLPEAAGKQIAVPGLTHALRFRTGRPRRVELMVDPMCNFRLFHSPVMGVIQIEPREEFRRWIEDVSA